MDDCESIKPYLSFFTNEGIHVYSFASNKISNHEKISKMINHIKKSINDITGLITESESLCLALIDNNTTCLINVLTNDIYERLVGNHILCVEI